MKIVIFSMRIELDRDLLSYLYVRAQVKAEETLTREQLQSLELELGELRRSFTVADQLAADQLNAATDQLRSLQSTVQRISQERAEVQNITIIIIIISREIITLLYLFTVTKCILSLTLFTYGINMKLRKSQSVLGTQHVYFIYIYITQCTALVSANSS